MASLEKIVIFILLMWVQQSKAQNLKPLFDTTQSMLIQVYENATVGSTIANIRVFDPENDPIVFSLDAAGNDLLDIGNNGNLTLQVELDRETAGQHEFTVNAADQCNGCDVNFRKTSRLFILFVLDVNDNKPVFVSNPFLARVTENDTIGHLVIQVSALDKDIGQNKQISYTFSPQTKTDTFEISTHDGKITLKGPLDFEKEQRYTLFVTAKDGGDPSLQSETTVIVDVSVVNDNPPKFVRTIYLEEIPENKAKGSMIVQVVAVDGDAGIGNKVTYEIISGNDEGLFSIDQTTGNITVNGTIDAEKTDFFRITVRASEIVDPSSSSTAVVLITVLDKNDNPPMCGCAIITDAPGFSVQTLALFLSFFFLTKVN